jgi:hypothetical protein
MKLDLHIDPALFQLYLESIGYFLRTGRKTSRAPAYENDFVDFRLINDSFGSAFFEIISTGETH